MPGRAHRNFLTVDPEDNIGLPKGLSWRSARQIHAALVEARGLAIRHAHLLDRLGARVLRRRQARVALAGMSLSDYLLSEIRAAAERPTVEELRARLRSRPEAKLSVTPAEAVRAEREGR